MTPSGARLDLDKSRRYVLGEMLARQARKRPDHVALRFEDEERSYADLDSRTNRLANALAERGVGHGDKVAVFMYNRLEVVESFFACQKLGACPVPVNFRLAPPEVEYILENCDAVGLLSDEPLACTAAEMYARQDTVRFHITVGQAAAGGERYEAVLQASEADAPDEIVHEDDLAFLMYTSGTTGRPKGAMLTHLNLMVNTVNFVQEIAATPDDVWLSGLPLFHIGAVNGLLPFIYVGGTCIVTSSTGFDAEASLRQLVRDRVTMCYFVPTQWQQICSVAEGAEYDMGRLRKAMWGASQAPWSTLEQMSRTFPGAGIVNAFGQTEMSSITTFLRPPDAIRKMGSVGTPVTTVEVRIVDERMRDVPDGEVGEIVYRGPTVMAGYYRNDEATDEAFEGGWFHSGDLVQRDEEGYITVVDRKKDMIISGGENIYPAELEQVLAGHDAVHEVAVVGVPHGRWVETPVAIVVPRSGEAVSEAELLTYVKERVASYKKPTAVWFIDELPRNAAGKILKRSLRQQYENESPGSERREPSTG